MASRRAATADRVVTHYSAGQSAGSGMGPDGGPDGGMGGGGHVMSAAKKVLVVDDNSSNRLLLKRLVTALGHVTLLAENGPEGVEMARTLSPDIILMDIVMPGMDGVQTMQKIREIGTEATIFACSAEVDSWGDSSFEEVGFDGFLSKPINVRKLTMLLRAA